MHALLLALIVTAPSTDLLAPYRGQPILSIEIAAPVGENPEELRALIGIEPGYLLDQRALKTSLKRLYALGRFSQISIYGKRIKGTVELTFELEPTHRVAGIDITGLDDVDEDGLLDALTVRVRDEVNSRTRELIAKHGRDHMIKVGYPDAVVTVSEMLSENETEVYFRVEVAENRPIRIESINFEGSPRLPRRVLESLLRSNPGDVLNTILLEDERKALIQNYIQHGFRTVQIAPIRFVATEAGTRVIFSIVAGKRIGIEFTGNNLLTNKGLLKLWPDPDGQLRTGDLHTFTKRIESYYRRSGYPQIEASVKGFSDRKNGSIRYLIQVHEGQPARVRSIQFSGNKVLPSETLRDHIHARISQELAPEGILESLRPIDQQSIRFGDSLPKYFYGTATSNSVPRIPNHLRWVEAIYEEALSDWAAAYKDRGFLQVKVGPIKKSARDGLLEIEIPIEEGPQTFLQSITFRGNYGIESSNLLQEISETTNLSPSASLSSSRVENARITILRQYRNNGYLYAKVFTKLTLSKQKTAADLAFVIEEGPQVHLDRILIRGNEFTNESLIRSRINLAPERPYRLDDAIESQRSIAALGVFSSANLRLIDEEVPSERKDLIAEVREHERHRIETVGGISTEDGPRIGLSYSHINLFGTASTFTTSAKFNYQTFFALYGSSHGESLKNRYDSYTTTKDQLFKALERELRLGVRSPQFVALPLSPTLRFDVTNLRDNRLSYSLDSTTAIFGAELFAGEHLKIAIDPQVNMTIFDCAGEFAHCQEEFVRDRQPTSREVQNHQGIKLDSTLTYDRRDNRFNPRSGFILSVNAQYALGADFENTDELWTSKQAWPSYTFTKLETRVTGYLPLFKGVLALAIWGGGVSMHKGNLEDTPLDERFFVGGRNSLRGFQEESLIPQDVCYERGSGPTNCKLRVPPVFDDPGPNSGEQRTISAFPSRGGNYYVLAKAELRWPLTDIVSLNVFVDSGNLWMLPPSAGNLALRFGTGAGLSFSTPVGPLNFSVGVNPEWRARNLESPIEYYFSIGQF